jgi:hypothetical protein
MEVKPGHFPESQKMFCIFERKIWRGIYGPVKDNGQWRIRYEGLYELYDEPDLVMCIKTEKASMVGTYPKDRRHMNS